MPQTALTKTPSSWGRSRTGSQLQTKRGQLEAELRQQELQQQLHQLELQERRLQTQTEGWSARPPLPSSVMRRRDWHPKRARSASGGTAAEDSELSPLVQALRHWGIRPVPELGPDMFGASIAQLKMLVRARDDQGRHHVAAVQALQRYVTQLEIDLDSKDDELAAAKRNLEEVQRHGFEPVEPEEVSAEAMEGARLSDSLRSSEPRLPRPREQTRTALGVCWGSEEAQQQLQLQVERAEAAEAKLVTLVERIRGAATAKKATEGVASASEERWARGSLLALAKRMANELPDEEEAEEPRCGWYLAKLLLIRGGQGAIMKLAGGEHKALKLGAAKRFVGES
eukprot:g3215.t1